MKRKKKQDRVICGVKTTHGGGLVRSCRQPAVPGLFITTYWGTVVPTCDRHHAGTANPNGGCRHGGVICLCKGQHHHFGRAA